MSDTTIGSRIRGSRELREMTQGELGESVDLNTSYISLIERDKKKPSVKALRRIAGALDEAPEFLETGHPTFIYTGRFLRDADSFRDEEEGIIDISHRYFGERIRLTVEVLPGRK